MLTHIHKLFNHSLTDSTDTKGPLGGKNKTQILGHWGNEVFKISMDNTILARLFQSMPSLSM